jgi:hydroxyacylglutathione hydrolase
VDILSVVDEGLGNSAYVVDLGDGGALLVDPERDPRPYLSVLAQRGLDPRFVVETHLHADFVSGSRELMGSGAELLAPAGSDLAYPHRALEDGEELDLGGLTLEVIATPGHTPEHLAYLLRDGRVPVAVFSGGTLMAGGVARPDLLAPEQTEPLARAAYRAIRQRLLTLPDDLPVYPTHGGGSFCAATPGGQRTTTIGRERTTNPLLADDPDEDTFVARLLGGLGSYPPYFLELRDVNRIGVDVLGPVPPMLPLLSVEAFDRVVGDGAEVVDVRSMQPSRRVTYRARCRFPGGRSSRPGWAGWCRVTGRSSSSPTRRSTTTIWSGQRARSGSSTWSASSRAAWRHGPRRGGHRFGPRSSTSRLTRARSSTSASRLSSPRDMPQVRSMSNSDS